MNKKEVEKQALELFAQCCLFGSSYRSVLNSMYETASEQNNYVKCDIINDLINEDINS